MNLTHLSFVGVILFLASCSEGKSVKNGDTYPCPEFFSPCVCSFTEDYDLTADCSMALDDASLTAAFANRFPFTKFKNLVIDQADIENSNLGILNDRSFGDVTFEEVRITHTQLHTIADGTFKNSHKTLKKLYLNSNKIGYFPFDSINNYEHLNDINLSGNNFAPDYLLQPITSNSLKYLELSNNPQLNFTAYLVSNCNVLERLYLKDVDLLKIPVKPEEPIGMFTGIETIKNIDFAKNMIEYIRKETIYGVANSLTNVDLSQNIIKTVEEHFVRGFSKTAKNTLNLSSNLIHELFRYIWEDIFIDVYGSGNPENSILLQGNPIFCGCSIEWLIRNDTLKGLLTSDTLCEDVITPVIDLPLGWFDENCNNKNHD